MKLLNILSLFLMSSFCHASLTSSDSTSSLYDHDPIIKIDKSNMVFLRGVVNSKSASKLINDMLTLKSKEIYLYIDSPGGSVLDGLQIIQAMDALQESGIRIYTIANNAASMAYIIHQFGTERYVKEWSILMQHQMSLGMHGQYYNLKAYSTLIDKIHQRLLEKQSQTANLTVDQFNDLTRHDMWVLGSDAVNRNFADKIVIVVCDFRPETYTETVNYWWFDVTFTYSTCPLAAKPLDYKIVGQGDINQLNNVKAIIEKEYNFDLFRDHNIQVETSN